MLKYASAAIMTADLAPKGASRRELRRFAHRHHFNYEVRPGYLYVRSRAISSRCNDNFDEFPAEELEKAYASFKGKPVFVNHVNHDHKRARGVIIDAALHKDSNRDGSKDYWVEVLMEVDAVRFPRLAKEILAGNIARTSMGCDVAFSVCSACGNKATTPAEYCQHIPASKGMMLYRRTASGQKVGEIIRETCYGLKFFENSLLVEPPADPTAYFLGVDTRGLQNTAMRKGAPFADYKDFENCTEQNSDKDDPEAYCGEIKHRTEDKKESKRINLADLGQRAQAARKTASSSDGWTEGESQSWDQIGERHPDIYGDREIHGEDVEGDGEGIGWAASHLAHSRPEDPDADEHGSWDLTFHSEHVDPYNIDHARHGSGDGRVRYAAEGYRSNPEQVPPLVLVHRHGVYQVADGHHRAEGAKLANQKTVRAYVAYSPYPNEPSGDGEKAPYHGAEEHPGNQPQWEKDLQAKYSRKTAYGEQKAPMDVDTLREDACPVCGDRDTFDGDTCEVCGYVAPPKIFQDPDLEKARQMDLRKDVAEFNDPANPNQVGPDGQPVGDPMDPDALDENGNPINPDAADQEQQPGTLPGEVQAEVQPDGDPMDPNALGEDGQIPDEDGEPVDPSLIGPDGQPLPGAQMTLPDGTPIGPQALPGDATTNMGQPFTPGPNMPEGPGEPEGPEGPMTPEDMDEDGQPLDPDAGQGAPGTPGDGVPDLMCPNCGFTAEAAQPTSIDMDTQQLPNEGVAEMDGVQAGDVCPNCGAAQLLSPAEVQGETSVPMPV
jgi:hypothetical protein